VWPARLGGRTAGANTAQGATSAVYARFQEDVVHCLAMLEAVIDFGEGKELEDGVLAEGPRPPSLHALVPR
jgi:tRNA modification GTPase